MVLEQKQSCKLGQLATSQPFDSNYCGRTRLSKLLHAGLANSALPAHERGNAGPDLYGGSGAKVQSSAFYHAHDPNRHYS